VPTGFGVILKNASPEPAILVTAALTVPAAPWPPPFGESVSASEADLAPWLAIQHGVSPATPPAGLAAPAAAIEVVSLGTAAITPGRLVLTGELRLALSWLSPGAGQNVLTLPDDGPALLAVETGQALVTSTAGPTDLVAPEASAVAAPAVTGAAPTIVLAAGQAALAEPETSLTIQTAGDHAPTLLLLTLAPA
jgi:hypothetical protein